MPFVSPKPGGWNLEEKLSSAQMNALLVNIAAADGSNVAGIAANVASIVALNSRLLTSHIFANAVLALDDAPPTTAGIAAVFNKLTGVLLACKGGANGTHILGDDARGDTVADCGTVTTVRDAAINPNTGLIVAVGTGGGFAAFTSNAGTSWTDSTTPIGARDRITWDPINSLFLASRAGNGNIYTSPSGVTFTTRALSAGTCEGGHATLYTGLSIASRGTGTGILFDRSTNGTTWANSGGTIPNVASADADGGCVCALGNIVLGGAQFFQIQRFATGNQLRVHSSPDGITWTLVSTINPPVSISSGGARIISDTDTNALYAIGGVTGAAYVWLSLDAGVTWLGPARFLAASTTGIQTAGGRLIINSSAVHRMSTYRLPNA